MVENKESRVIVALDFPRGEQAAAFVDRLKPGSCRLKVGKELFTREGPELVRRFVGQGHDVFLDLKFHDIPNTVARACEAAAALGVWMVNVHASGGRRMMDAAREAVAQSTSNTKLIAVTVLTSMNDADLRELGIETPANIYAQNLAKLAADAQLDGVVCSAQEASQIKSRFGQGFLCVTPGIRPAGSDQGDQRRIMTPENAMANGSDYLVIGRPITQAADPAKVVADIYQSLVVNKKG